MFARFGSRGMRHASNTSFRFARQAPKANFKPQPSSGGKTGATGSTSTPLGQTAFASTFSRSAINSIERQCVQRSMTMALSSKLPLIVSLAARGPSALLDEESEAEEDDECKFFELFCIICVVSLLVLVASILLEPRAECDSFSIGYNDRIYY